MKEKIIENKKYILLFTLSLIIFLIIFLCFYPGIYTYDSAFQWNEIVTGKLTESHPFLSTYFMYALSKIYKYPTIVILFQMIVSSLSITKMFKIGKIKNNYIEFMLCLLISIFPLIALFTITMWKDILYSYYLLNLALILYEWSKSKYKFSCSKMIIMGLLIFLIYSYRLNGKIVAIFLLIYIFIITIKQKYRKKQIIIPLLIFISCLSLLQIPKSIYLIKPVNTNTNLQPLDSYMIWITGEYLNKGVVKEKDLVFLNKISDINSWAGSYNPYIINSSNELKRDMNFYINNKKKYQKIFVNLTIKNFDDFIKHYIKSDSLLYSPYCFGYIYTYGIFDDINNSIIDLKVKSKMPKLYGTYSNFTIFTLKNKIIRIITYTPANALYLSILLAIIIYKKYKDKCILLLIHPMLFNTISLVPINIAQDLRYVYINYLTFIAVLIIFIGYLRNKRGKKNENIINNSII